MSVEYKKHALGEAVKGLTVAILSVVIAFFGQQWLNNDLEYKVATKDGYLSTTLGEQGLGFSYGGKPISNVSVVDIPIFNRTGKQFNDVDLLFTVHDPKGQYKLVSSGIVPPMGLLKADVIEELVSKSTTSKYYRIKFLPKLKDSEYFRAVFVFDGDKAPPMSLVSTTRDAPIESYKEWKDSILAIVILLLIVAAVMFVTFFFSSFADYFRGPRDFKKRVERFTEKAISMSNAGELKSTDPDALTDAAHVFASFTRPTPSKWWSKIFGEQKFEY